MNRDTLSSACLYYQAHIKRQSNLHVVSILKSFDHLCFDRTLDAKGDGANTIFEFFVPPLQEDLFLKLMNYFEREGLVNNLKKLPNRLLNSTEQL